MKNQCIKKQHRTKVIEYFKSFADATKFYEDFLIGGYYGLSTSGFFTYNDEPCDSEVIELPTETEFKRGDKVWVWDDDDVISERIFLTKIEGAAHPYICVMKGKESAFLKGEPYLINIWKNCKHSIQIELTLQDISDGKGVGVDPKLIKIILI
jgi:hypothetical protein